MLTSLEQSSVRKVAGTGRLPSFLIVGAAKSGTTSICSYLKQHPEVFLPINKEPNYFVGNGAAPPMVGPASRKVLQDLLYSYCITNYGDYRALFAPAGDAKAIVKRRFVISTMRIRLGE
jgi:hypothetical protein